MTGLLAGVLAGSLLVPAGREPVVPNTGIQVAPVQVAQVRQTLPEEKPAAPLRVITPPPERWSVEARVGYHVFPKTGYLNALKDNPRFPVGRDSMSGAAVEVGVDYRALTLLTVGGTLAVYRGVLDYQDGSRFQTEVTPIMFNAKYWGFNRPGLHPYIGAGAGFVSIRRSLSLSSGVSREQTDLIIGQQLLVGFKMAFRKTLKLVVDDRYTFARGSRPILLNERESGNTDDGGNTLSVGLAWMF